MTLFYYEDAVISYVIEQWKNITNNRLGRTIIQKMCYFIKYEGVSLDFRFRLHHFGPFSQKLFLRMDELKSDDVIKDALDEPERSAYEIGDNALEVMNHFSKDLSPEHLSKKTGNKHWRIPGGRSAKSDCQFV